MGGGESGAVPEGAATLAASQTHPPRIRRQQRAKEKRKRGRNRAKTIRVFVYEYTSRSHNAQIPTGPVSEMRLEIESSR